MLLCRGVTFAANGLGLLIAGSHRLGQLKLAGYNQSTFCFPRYSLCAPKDSCPRDPGTSAFTRWLSAFSAGVSGNGYDTGAAIGHVSSGSQNEAPTFLRPECRKKLHCRLWAASKVSLRSLLIWPNSREHSDHAPGRWYG